MFYSEYGDEKSIRLVKIMIATGRKVLVKKMKALTVIRRSYL